MVKTSKQPIIRMGQANEQPTGHNKVYEPSDSIPRYTFEPKPAQKKKSWWRCSQCDEQQHMPAISSMCLEVHKVQKIGEVLCCK